jgi:RND family efflux transporter MFP subunit
MRRLSPPALLCWTALAIVPGCSREAPEEVETETVVSVKTEAAIRGDIRRFVHATGIVKPAPGAELIVVAPESARILAIPKAAGEPVRRGDILVRFEIPTAAAEVERQEAEVARAAASVENAKAAQTRARELFERGVAARKDVEEADRAVADAAAALAQARASVGSARAVAARATVRAAFDGVIAERMHNAGDLVEPAASDPVLRVVDPRRFEVVASVPLADAIHIRVGAPAKITGAPLDAGESRLTVLSRAVAVETNAPSVPVRLGFSAAAAYPAGTPLQIAIGAEERKRVVLVPAAALVREGEETAVFVASNGKAQRRKVKIGLSDETHVEIVSGIDAGEQVIVDGQAGLPDETAITTEKELAPGKDKRE